MEESIFPYRDPSGMYSRIYNFPKQVLEAWEIGERVDVSPLKGSYSNIVVVGMGGSAIGGDIIKSLGYNELSIPLLVIRDYNLPRFVNENTLLIAVSYSGDTEESLTICEEGLERKARVIVIGSGGKLIDLAREKRILSIVIPNGFQPRAALGYTFIPLLSILSRLGFLNINAVDIKNTSGLLEKIREEELKDDVPKEKNIAKKIADKLYKHLPVIYAPNEYFGVIAYRWKCQINENSKAFSVWNNFPELNHNEIIGWEGRDEILKQNVVILLRDSKEIERIRLRIRYMKDFISSIIEEENIIEVWSRGETLLERFLSLIYIGDFVSFYLAIKRGVDPTPVKSISGLKEFLGREGR
ncbi:MAG: bifunctional phosphoglucose/phosphomannose isomerase [bacterium]